MIIRDTPKNIEDFISVDNDVANILEHNNFQPMYMDCKKVYFKKSKEILDFIKGGEMCGRNS